MRQKVEFRELKRKDKKELYRLLKEEEKYEEFFEKAEDAEIYAKAVLERYLGTCTYRKVAAVGEQIVGEVLLHSFEDEKEKQGGAELLIKFGTDGTEITRRRTDR